MPFLCFGYLSFVISKGQEDDDERGIILSVKVYITSITPVLQFFQISLVFKMFSTLMLVEVKLSGI